MGMEKKLKEQEESIRSEIEKRLKETKRKMQRDSKDAVDAAEKRLEDENADKVEALEKKFRSARERLAELKGEKRDGSVKRDSSEAAGDDAGSRGSYDYSDRSGSPGDN